MPSKRTYVLDTSVLLYSANSIRSFGSKNVVIPYVVLEELDKFKTRDDDVGANARQVARELNRLRREGSIQDGVQVTEKGGKLRVELNFQEPVSHLLNPGKVNDDRILNVCLGLKGEGKEVRLVTKDVNLAVRADVLGLEAQDFESDKLVDSIDDLYTGVSSITTSAELIDAFYAGDDVFLEDMGLPPDAVNPNQYLMLSAVEDPSKTALARYIGGFDSLARVRGGPGAWGIKPRNREQQFAMDALLDPSIQLLTLTGAAGTGKTLCALACALHQVQDTDQYTRLVVSRPVQPLGKDIGYLPGDINEKMSPWMGPIKDSLEFLTRNKDSSINMYEELIALRHLEVEPLTYIRGRSMPKTIFVLDEAQDMTRPEIKTIVSRMGEGSKLILIGDVMQITNPYLDTTNNGLSIVAEKFKSYDFAAHITLSKGERSTLATIASEIL